MTCVVGVDTGGTFTDVVVLDDGGRTISAKASTTPDDLEVGIVNALRQAASQNDETVETLLSRVDLFRLSGTTVTNVLVTGRGVTTGLVTTRGFEDTLHIGRAKSAWAGLTEEQVRKTFDRRKPTPLVPKHLVRGISERIDRSGSVVVPLDRNEVLSAAAELIEAGVEALAIGFLWSVRNPDHELECGRILAEAFPEISVHLSHRVAATVGEYERFATTVIDALAGPVMRRLLTRLRSTLAELGFRGELLVAQADGGVVYADETRPVATLHSGPAAGVIASRNEGIKLGISNIVTADVGGTSFDVAVIADGAWALAREPVQSQYSLSLPMIAVDSVGAGGGSIAWLDDVGSLHVGPQSAGANPGPVCYGNGGTAPTVTDAALVLGYIDPKYFLGGRLELDVELARSALAAIGEPLDLNAVETAAGIFQIANARMSGLLRQCVLSRGHDARDFTVFAFGGAGGFHGAAYTEEAGMPEVVFPSLSATFSAYGVATAPLLHSRQRHEFARLPMDASTFVSHFKALEAEVTAMLDRDGVDDEQRSLVYGLELRYGLQVHTVRVQLSRDEAFAPDFDVIHGLFDKTYEKLHGQGSGYGDAGRFVTGFVIEGFGQLPVPETARVRRIGMQTFPVGEREMHFAGSFMPSKIVRQSDLEPGDTIDGPAAIESNETTIVVPPGRTARIDDRGNVRIPSGEAGA